MPITLLLALYFAKVGSKRVVGGLNSFFMVLLLPFMGIIIVLTSRRIDDEQKDKELLEKYRWAKTKAGLKQA